MDHSANTIRVLDAVRKAVHDDREPALSGALYDLSTIVLERGEYDLALMNAIVTVATTDRARRSAHAWLLWKHFEENWDLLGAAERAELRRIVEDEFVAAGHWMTSFVIGVLLAECYADAGAMDALARLRLRCNAERKALLPDAIRNLAAHTNDLLIRQQARHELDMLARDPSPEVRAEAARAIARREKR